jgi:putative transposase
MKLAGKMERETTPKGVECIFDQGYRQMVSLKFIVLVQNQLMSYRQIFYQIVFSTKNRERTITEEHSEELYKYIWGVIKNRNCKLYRINGIEDHIHIFSDLHPSISLADYIKDIKVASGLWMKESGMFKNFRGWQDGYGAFTYSVKEKDKVAAYIKDQKMHHRSESFHDEYKRLLTENDISFDEKYLL